jgi:DNA-directed RNA polymerase subunit RPC12/RpoP
MKSTANPKPRKPSTQYRCSHCGISGVKKKDGVSRPGRGWLECKRCKFGALTKMHWNGFRWC